MAVKITLHAALKRVASCCFKRRGMIWLKNILVSVFSLQMKYDDDDFYDIYILWDTVGDQVKRTDLRLPLGSD
jgi:hypothetical protein